MIFYTFRDILGIKHEISLWHSAPLTVLWHSITRKLEWIHENEPPGWTSEAEPATIKQLHLLISCIWQANTIEKR